MFVVLSSLLKKISNGSKVIADSTVGSRIAHHQLPSTLRRPLLESCSCYGPDSWPMIAYQLRSEGSSRLRPVGRQTGMLHQKASYASNAFWPLRLPASSMCDYTQVEYACGHLRFTVRAWCKSRPSHTYVDEADTRKASNTKKRTSAVPPMSLPLSIGYTRSAVSRTSLALA